MTVRRTRLEKLAQFLNENSNDLGRRGPVELDPDLLYGEDDMEDGEDVVGVDTSPMDEEDWIGTDVYDPDLLRLINETSASRDGRDGRDELSPTGSGYSRGSRGTRDSGGISITTGSVTEVPVAASRLEQRLAALRQAEEEKLMAECTFKPKTGRAPRRTNMNRLYGASDRDDGMAASERLFLMQHGQRRQAAIVRYEEEAERAFRETCTFTPALMDDSHSKVKSSLYKLPLQERVGMEWRKREEIVRQATARADIECTFRPEINQTSRKIAALRKQKEAEGGVRRKMALNAPLGSAKDGVRGSAWAVVNQESERILRTSETIPEGFHERQAYFEQMRKNKHERMFRAARDQEAEMASSFVASVPVGVLNSERLERQMQETADERLQRMSHGEAEAARRRREMRKRELDAQFSHAPSLNQVSLEMARDLPSIRERVAAVKSTAAVGVDKECTFRPDTRKPAVRGFYSRYEVPNVTSTDFARAADERADRARAAMARVAEERRAEEIKEMEECTFKPVTNGGRVRKPRDDVPLELMPGMGRFVEKLVMQHEGEMAKKAREDEVFGHASRWKNELTVVRPFHLGLRP